MKGDSFPSRYFDYSNLEYLSDFLGIKQTISGKILHSSSSAGFPQNILDKVPIPQTLADSLQFISTSDCENFEPQFNQSLEIIIQNFSSLSVDELSKLSTSHLLKIFSSESLEIESEDKLLELLISMIKENKQKIILLKTVHFEFVSSELLEKLFENISNDEIDLELFGSLKNRLIENYSDREKLANRWGNKTDVISSKEKTDILQIINSYFGEKKEPLEQIKRLIKENKTLKIESDELKYLNVKGKIFRYQNDANGIFQNLKQQKDTFLFNCSSCGDPSHKPENLSIHDNSTRFLSKDTPNSWVFVNFD
jgi:hypothetical protein